MRISNSVTLTAIVNGATYLTSFEREENTPPLFQFWDKNNNAVTPDWTSGSHPIVYAKCTDTTGKEYQINNAVLVYNNAEITFDVNGFSTNSVSIEGKPNFKKDTKVVGGITYTRFHIIENLFGDNNSDSDIFLQAAYGVGYCQNGESINDIMKMADQNMYTHKKFLKTKGDGPK